MLYNMNNNCQNTIFQIYFNVPLMKTASFSGSRFFQCKALLLVKTNSFSESRSLQWKPLLLVETFPFGRSHSFQWKPFFSVKNIPFIGSHSFQQKPFIFMETIAPSGRHSFYWKPFPLLETVRFSFKCFFSFSGSCFFRGNHWPQQKQFLLVETAPFDRWNFLYWKLFL